MTILAAKRNRTIPMRVDLRISRIVRPGYEQRTTNRTHPVRKAQKQRNYKALAAVTERQHSYQPDDRVYPVGRVIPRQRIEGINVPHPTEDWQSLNEWRARFNLAPIEPW